ncbi:MAG TPA: ferritin-like domain-containing protein [Phycisphaerales bacterium]|nr:ferritin-like domain-containing protein [Phycisphaerales bacterium]
MKLESLSDLYIAELQDVYNAERQLLKALPKLAKSAQTTELKNAIQEHLEVTQNHVTRLEKILNDLNERPGGEVCEAMQGLVAEGEEVMKADGEDAVRDAGLIMAAQKVEHYEIASYGSLKEFAHLLNREQDAALLEQTLEEEKQADLKLTQLAEQVVNRRAVA